MISEIVNVLADIVDGMNKKSSLDEVVKYINIKNKYDKNVIATAYSWIYEKLVREILSEEEEALSPGFRIFSDKEISTLGMVNYNYLVNLFNIGLLTNSDLSLIMDRVMLFRVEQISLDDINLIILSLFLDIDNAALPGSRLLLNSSDIIN